MASNQQLSVRVLLAIGLTIGVALGAAGDNTTAFAAGGSDSEVGWGTISSITNGSATSVTAAFPSTFSTAQTSANATYGTGNPVVFYKTKMGAAVKLANKTGTTGHVLVFSLEVEGAAFKVAATTFHANVQAAGNTASAVCANALTGFVLTDTIVADNIFNVLCTPTTAADEDTDLPISTFFGIYFSGSAEGFYPQCGMKFNAAISGDEGADLTIADYITVTAGFTGTATEYICGCTVQADSLTHTGGKLTLDVVLTSPVEVPYTVFQLASDSSEKLLFDTSATATPDDYLATWSAATVTATFTTVSAAADPLTTSDSVTATLPKADAAADLNATLVSLDTDGTTAAKADVATDGTTEKPVKFEFTFVKDLCLGNEKVYVNCFLYGAAAANAAVDETVAANYKGKGTAQSFDCESGSDDSGAENSIGFSMFLLMLTALAIEL